MERVQLRVQLILYDHAYVAGLQTGLPVVPNERCGPWYLPNYPTTTYFKSTDGHTNEWQFSYRRLNLHILPLIEAHGGVVILDGSKTKPLPDALSKTVPIWCAVLNMLVFGDSEVVLPEFVSHEHPGIALRIPHFVAEINRLGLFSVSLSKRLNPVFVYNHGNVPEMCPEYLNVVCVGVSDTTKGGDYIAGAADDHELWVGHVDRLLTPALFWDRIGSHVHDGADWAAILAPPAPTGQSTAQRGQTGQSQTDQAACPLEYWQVPGTTLYWGKTTGDWSTAAPFAPEVDTVIVLSQHVPVPLSASSDNPDSSSTNNCSPSSVAANDPHTTNGSGDRKDRADGGSAGRRGGSAARVMAYRVESNKKGAKMLRQILPELKGLSGRILVVCDTGEDLSVGALLVLMSGGTGSKDRVRQMLSVVSSVKRVNPSRNTLQSVHTAICPSK